VKGACGPRQALPGLVLTALVVGLPWAPSAVSAQAPTPSPAPSAADPGAASVVDLAKLVETGRSRYTGSCARCHGIGLVTVGIGFDLRTFPSDGKERFVRSVNGGVRAMPAFQGSIKPEDLDAIWTYIGSVNGWPATREATTAR
jgi:mono/diheme cytochrome c family protein